VHSRHRHPGSSRVQRERPLHHSVPFADRFDRATEPRWGRSHSPVRMPHTQRGATPVDATKRAMLDGCTSAARPRSYLHCIRFAGPHLIPGAFDIAAEPVHQGKVEHVWCCGTSDEVDEWTVARRLIG
jgi:hypothetical protein